MKLQDMETKMRSSERQTHQLQQENECKNRQISQLKKRFEDVKDLIASESSIYSSRIADIIMNGDEPSDQEEVSTAAGSLAAMT